MEATMEGIVIQLHSLIATDSTEWKDGFDKPDREVVYVHVEMLLMIEMTGDPLFHPVLVHG
jgi:hypothetical protein